MKTLLLSVLLGLSPAVYASGDTALFKDGVLMIPELLRLDGAEPVLLRQARLRRQPAGDFRIVGFDTVRLAVLQSVSADAAVPRGEVLLVHLEGVKSLQCVMLDPVHPEREPEGFRITVTEQPVPANVRCITGQHPFSLDVAIPTAGLQPGEYRIHAHAHSIVVQVLED